MRQINLAAGQRNPCAVAYHIGSKDELLEAVLAHHRVGINQRRLAMVADLRRDGRAQELRALAEAMVLPLAELLPPSSGANYLRVMAQAIGHPRYHKLARGRDHGEGLSEVLGLLRARYSSEVPAELLDQRFGMALRLVFHALADYLRIRPARGADPESITSLFVSNLVDSIAGLLGAPVSVETWGERRYERRQSA